MPCTTQYYCVCVRCVCVFTHAKVVVKGVLPEATPAACVLLWRGCHVWLAIAAPVSDDGGLHGVSTNHHEFSRLATGSESDGSRRGTRSRRVTRACPPTSRRDLARRVLHARKNAGCHVPQHSRPPDGVPRVAVLRVHVHPVAWRLVAGLAALPAVACDGMVVIYWCRCYSQHHALQDVQRADRQQGVADHPHADVRPPGELVRARAQPEPP